MKGSRPGVVSVCCGVTEGYGGVEAVEFALDGGIHGHVSLASKEEKRYMVGKTRCEPRERN